MDGLTEENDEYKIKLSEISKKLKEVYDLGYGDTIHLTINGESYEVVNDMVKNNKKKLIRIWACMDLLSLVAVALLLSVEFLEGHMD